jgi:2-polyprenyl-6-methoxyphenol hydroxylase-like FAD-dependent oxidoreductase
MASIAIQGDGVAACCSAFLLKRAGNRVSLKPTNRSRVPAIMLSEAALELIRDVFGNPDLLRDAHRIRKRVVAWGRDAAATVLEHSAAVVSEQTLLEALLDGNDLDVDHCEQHAQWRILASRPVPKPAVEHRFGSRFASAVKVRVRDGFDFGSCWIESLESGWLFLIPDSSKSAWLLSVGQTPESLVGSSGLIAKEIAEWQVQGGPFPSAPSIIAPLAGQCVDGSGWLACGTAAMSFDPICGDGTAHAIREAILAAAIVCAAAKGEKTGQLLAHYSSRLLAGFDRHLRLCGNFYGSGYGGVWWDSELNRVEEGIEWCSEQNLPSAEFQYQLRGFELEAIA